MDIMCNDSRFEIIDKAKKHLLEATNIDTSLDEMKMLDNFLFRCWQMGWLDRYDNCDPVDIHDEISEGFSRIEKAIREESAKMAEIIRQSLLNQGAYLYKTPLGGTLYWNDIPGPCKNCTNHPANGGSGVCHCTLGTKAVTSDCSWK